MKIVALFIALILERLATHLFHWRDLRWLDPLFDLGLRKRGAWSFAKKYLWAIAVLLIAIAPVLLARIALHDTLLGLPYLALSVIVLFLSLGPQDIGEEVDRWCAALDSGDKETEHNYAVALLERPSTETPHERDDVVRAVFAQANNRMFAVIFWFLVLGPIGAWLFRVADLLRRRAIFVAERRATESGEQSDEQTLAMRESVEQASYIHGLLAALPARISAMGYILAGDYDNGRAAWRKSTTHVESAPTPNDRNEALLAGVGYSALNLSQGAEEDDTAWHVRSARAAKNLVLRSLVFWLVGVALLTLAGLAA